MLNEIARRPDRFTIEHRERARFLRSKGATRQEIATFFGRPLSTVYGWVRDVPTPPLEELVSFKNDRRAA